jgi:hypothetical protein
MFYLIFALVRLMIYAVTAMVMLMFWLFRMMVMLIAALATAISSGHAGRGRVQVSQGRHRSG